jgi:aldoxime dehydratase
MESAIPPHLRCPRTREPRASADYKPPYPAWVARMKPSVSQVVMAYFGVQSKGDQHAAVAADSMAWLLEQFAVEGGPGHHDLARYVDEEGFDTVVAIAYWDDPSVFQRWLAGPSLSQWWNDEQRTSDGVGYFREIVCPKATHFETLFSTPDRFEGVAVLADALSDEIQEHGYWGGARDRLPIAQTDGLRTTGAPSTPSPAPKQRVRVQPHDNLTLIRSGQEWTETTGKERQLYLEEVEPVLRQGMDFLRDNGVSIGCYVNRYMQHVGPTGAALQKSFGMSFWRSLEHLERWAESHPTHVAIFGTFMKMVQAMNFDLKLRLYHEVTVVERDEQFFEYVNCHPKTGLLRAAGSS